MQLRYDPISSVLAQLHQERGHRMSKFKVILWLDFRQPASTPGIFQSIPLQYVQDHRVPPCDTISLIQTVTPQQLCLEFAIPQHLALTASRQARLQCPDTPSEVVTETHSESLARWAYRLSVPDDRVKPLSAERLTARLEWLIRTCLERSKSYICPAGAAPLQTSLPWHAPQTPTPQLKTLAARAFVAAHFAEVIRLAHAADLCHMCTSEFSRAFKKENGHPFSEYLLRYRICKACELLAGPSVQVKTVAFNVGFNDLSYFARVFRRYTGSTPSLYQCIASGKSPDACDAKGA